MEYSALIRGTFVAISSHIVWKQAIGAGAEVVLLKACQEAGISVQTISSQLWDPNTSTVGGIRDILLSYFSSASAGWASLLLPLDASFARILANAISKIQSSPVILFLEMNQLSWGYDYFREGRCLDQFRNRPQIFGESAPTYRGNVAVISAEFGVEKHRIAPYLQQLDHSVSDSQLQHKAFPTDEFFLSDHWVRVDFMSKLGIVYPNPGETPGLYLLVE